MSTSRATSPRASLLSRQFTRSIEIRTRGKGFYPFTREAAQWVTACAARTALLTVFCRHTSASLLIQENADPDVVIDLAEYFERAAPEGEPYFRHTTEGPDDMPAHIRAALTPTSLTIPVAGGHMALGTWQGLYLFEHRSAPHSRTVVLHLIAGDDY
jgi:secondary thiamine-phosphate synthase enzyme